MPQDTLGAFFGKSSLACVGSPHPTSPVAEVRGGVPEGVGQETGALVEDNLWVPVSKNNQDSLLLGGEKGKC